jgi:hypothetical protein
MVIIFKVYTGNLNENMSTSMTFNIKKYQLFNQRIITQDDYDEY